MSSTLLHTIQNECPELGCVSTRSEQPQVTVKISSEVEMLPVRTMNYDVHNNHWKIECDYRKRPKAQTFL
jgi:hypothetical protein